MSVATPIQSDFSGGEIGALVQGRVGFDTYKKSCALLLNWIATLQGAIIRRPGTAFVAPTKFSNSAVNLLPFTFSNNQSYVLEFGAGYIRFYTQEGQLLQTAAISGITKASNAVVTATAHGFVNGMTVTLSGVTGMTQINGQTSVISGVTTNTFTVNINSVGYTSYVSGGTATAIYEITTSPYAAADVGSLYTSQSGDTLYIAHRLYPPYRLVRNSNGTFSISLIAFTDGPYLNPAVANVGLKSAITLTLSSTTIGAVTCTASAPLFSATDATNGGRSIRLTAGGTYAWGIITAFTSTTVVTVTLQTTPATVTQTTNWRLGLWCDTLGWPACCVFHENRLVWAGALGDPQAVTASNSSDFLNMTPTDATGNVLATHSYYVEISSGDLNTINQILWMASAAQGLQCGTSGTEFLVTPGASADFIQPTSAFASAQSSHGSAAVKPVKIDRATIYVQRAGAKIRELMYFFVIAGFDSEDLTILNPEVTSSGIIQMAVTREPYPIVWCLRKDGMLAAVTYQRDTQSLRVAWHRHQLGGHSSANGDAPNIVSIAAIPTVTAPPGNTVQDELWMVVQRYVNGAAVQYVEYMTPYFVPYSQSYFALPVAANFLDCSASGVNGYEISGASTTNPATVTLTVSPTTFNVGDSVVVDGLQGTDGLNGRVYVVSNISGAVVSLASANNGPPPAAVTGITNASPAVVTAASHGFINGTSVTLSGVAGMTQINGLTAVISSVTTNTFAMTLDSSAFSAYSSGGTALDLSGIINVDATAYGLFLQASGTQQAQLFPKLSTLPVGTYLNGETISVLADGAAVDNVGPVSAGNVSIPLSGGFCTWGYPYNSDFQSLRFDAGAQNGTSWGKTQRMHRIGIQTYEQGNLRAGFDFDNLQLLALPSSKDPGGVGHPLQSGHLSIQLPNGTPQLDQRICIRASEPLPASVLSISPMLETNDRT